MDPRHGFEALRFSLSDIVNRCYCVLPGSIYNGPLIYKTLVILVWKCRCTEFLLFGSIRYFIHQSWVFVVECYGILWVRIGDRCIIACESVSVLILMSNFEGINRIHWLIFQIQGSKGYEWISKLWVVRKTSDFLRSSRRAFWMRSDE